MGSYFNRVCALITEQVENLDKLLDELEDLARSDLSSSRFFATLIDRLRLTLDLQSTVLMLPIDEENWIAIAESGAPSESAQEVLCKRIRAESATPENLVGVTNGCQWMATPIRPSKFSRGCLLAVFKSSGHAGGIAQSLVASVLELMAAFSEIVAIRQQTELESFLDEFLNETLSLCNQIGSAKSIPEASSLLANGLARTLRAARVSVLSRRSLGGVQLSAISGVPIASARSQSIKALERVAKELIAKGRPILRQQPTTRSPDGTLLPEMQADGTFSNLICTQLSGTLARGSSPPVLVIEYQSYPEMVSGAARAPNLLPIVGDAWERHVRWLRLPRSLRNVLLGPIISASALIPLVKWTSLIAIAVLGIMLLTKPIEMVVEAEGALEPVTVRTVYANQDGFVAHILVADGSAVRIDDPLVQLRSPALELQIEQTEGESRTLFEEVNGVRIAINQLDPDAPDVIGNQSRLAAKIVELETRERNLQQQLKLLYEQRDRLLLRSPIDGNIVAKDLKQVLDGRPVRRGEALFTVADFEAAWQIRVDVADRDSGYVRDSFRGLREVPGRETLKSEIRFTLASDPAELFPAKIHWISERVENKHGLGCYVEVRAVVENESLGAQQAGAGVHAFFDCGNQPLWFVWCRPIIEAAQRRLWLRSIVGNE